MSDVPTFDRCIAGAGNGRRYALLQREPPLSSALLQMVGPCERLPPA